MLTRSLFVDFLHVIEIILSTVVVTKKLHGDPDELSLKNYRIGTPMS